MNGNALQHMRLIRVSTTSDILRMALFPDEFPFNQKAEPEIQPAQVPTTVETRIEMDADIQPIAPQPQQVNSSASEGAASERRRSPRQSLLTKAMLRGDAGP